MEIHHIGSTAVPRLAAEYTALKRALAERFRDDREGYTEAKTPFIKRVERTAHRVCPLT